MLCIQTHGTGTKEAAHPRTAEERGGVPTLGQWFCIVMSM